MKKRMQVAVVGFSMLVTGYLLGQVDPRRNPNIAAAQQYCEQALSMISAAQQANQFDMQGHAKRAQGLIERAIQELNAAAAIANQQAR